jgi:hypothetical protein
MGQRMWCGARVVAAAVLVSAGHAAWAQSSQDPMRNPFKPPTFNEIMSDQARELGSQLDARNRLAAERAGKIRDYSAQLAACGNCAQRADLQQALDHWKRADEQVNQVENAALATMGLGHYRNIGDLQVGMLEEFAIASLQVAAQQRRRAEIGEIAMMVGHECGKKHAVERKAGCTSPLKGEALRAYNQNMAACRAENDPLRLYANDQMVREVCSKLPDTGACIAKNSILVKAQAYNQAAAQDGVKETLARRRQGKEEDARRVEASVEARAQKEAERERLKTMSPQERNAFQRQRMEEFSAMVKERTRARRECENG